MLGRNIDLRLLKHTLADQFADVECDVAVVFNGAVTFRTAKHSGSASARLRGHAATTLWAHKVKVGYGLLCITAFI